MTTTPENWLSDKLPIFKFLAIANGVLLIYFLLRPTPLITEGLGPWNLRASAAAATRVLSWLGEDVGRIGVEILSARGGLKIQRGCDVVGPSVLLIAAIVAFPCRAALKVPGVLVGVPALFAVNLLRIVSLYFAQIHLPRAFETLHVAVWPPAIVGAVLLLFVSWALWAGSRT